MYKFVEFADTIVNTKYISNIRKCFGTYEKRGKFALAMILDGFENLTEWFDSESDRDTRFNELLNILSEKG